VQAPNFTGDTISLSSLISGGDCFQTGGALDDPDFLSAILPLDPFADADAAFDRQDFFPALLSQFTKDGQLWGLPAELNPTVLEYNRELFDAAGVPYPTQAWTLDQFVDAAIALTDGDGEFKTYGFVPDAFELTTMLVMIERYGANLIDDSIDPPTLAFTSDRTIEALRWYVNLAKELGVKPAFVTDPSQLGNDPTSFIEREGIIDEGRAGMWTTFGPTAGATGFGLGNRAAMDIGVAPLPLGPGGGAGFDQASGYFIAADTTQRRACWDWLTFLTESADAVQGLPGRISVAESAAYRQKVGAERADAYIASIADTSEGGIFRFFGTSQGGWLGPSIFWLGRAHSQAVDEVFTVEEALSEAQAKFDEYRSCIIANDAIDDADGQNDCLEEVDPTLGAFFGG
jgi:ABC-type glycerol-3-phosphate transport system substrate-binding protein